MATVGSTAGGTEVSASEKRAEAGPAVQADEDQGADAGGEQARQGHQAQRRPADAGGLHDQERAEHGEPSSVLIAAKLPADAITVTAIGGASFFSRWMVSAARPPPIAISGASGPRTAPRLSVVSAARMMPGSSRSRAPPPVLNPKAGEWPPFPGR